MNKGQQLGSLFVLVTPIGNLNDVSVSVLKKLKELDYVYSEDTRVTRKLLLYHGIKLKNRLRMLNDHNEKEKSKEAISFLKQGFNVGITSDAGYPVVCDPGYHLLRICRKNNISIDVVGSNSSVLSALLLSGFEPYPFFFMGYLNFISINKARDQIVEGLNSNYTTVLLISKHDLSKLGDILYEHFPKQEFAVVKEISKIYQKVYIGLGNKIIKEIPEDERRGEFVFLVRRTSKKKSQLSSEAKKIIELIDQNGYKLKEIAQKISLITKDNVNQIYKYLLKREK